MVTFVSTLAGAGMVTFGPSSESVRERHYWGYFSLFSREKLSFHAHFSLVSQLFHAPFIFTHVFFFFTFKELDFHVENSRNFSLVWFCLRHLLVFSFEISGKNALAGCRRADIVKHPYKNQNKTNILQALSHFYKGRRILLNIFLILSSCVKIIAPPQALKNLRRKHNHAVP